MLTPGELPTAAASSSAACVDRQALAAGVTCSSRTGTSGIGYPLRCSDTAAGLRFCPSQVLIHSGGLLCSCALDVPMRAYTPSRSPTDDQLNPALTANARFGERDRSSGEAGLRTAGLANTGGRRRFVPTPDAMGNPPGRCDQRYPESIAAASPHNDHYTSAGKLRRALASCPHVFWRPAWKAATRPGQTSAYAGHRHDVGQMSERE